MIDRKGRLASLLLATAACAAPLGARAADAPVGNTSVSVEEVVVTARKREESLQKTPVAVSAFSGERLETASIQELRDVAQLTPNLYIFAKDGTPSGNFIQIRSQRQPDGLITLDPAVGVYADGIYLGRANALNMDLDDVERVEVLKGAQGTLFGRNTTGGAIQIISRAPSGKPGGRLSASYGSFNEFVLKGAVELPISDKLKGRLSGALKQRDGYAQSVTTGQELEDADRAAVKAIFDFEPAAGTLLRFTADYTRARENGAAFRISKLDPTNPTQLYVPGVLDASQATVAGYAHDSRNSRADTVQHSNSDVWGVGLIATHDLGGATLKYTAGYRRINDEVLFDSDGTEAPLSKVALNLKSYWAQSHELQLNGVSLNGALEWIGGLYYFEESGVDQTLATLALFGLDPVTFDGTGHNSSIAAFGQLDYTLPQVPNLTLTAGGRLTRDTRELDSRNRTTIIGLGTICSLLTSGGLPLSPCERSVSETFEEPTWTLGADYQVNPDVFVYGAVRRGYRAGGFNLRALDSSGFTPFKPETVTDYELGLKTDFTLGGAAARVNVAVFHSDYEQIQRSTIVPAVSGTLQTIIFNAASAQVNGVEVDLTARLTPEWTVTAGYGASVGKYKTFMADTDGNGVLEDLHDLKFPGPEHQASVSVRYEGSLVSGQVDYAWTDTVYDGQTTIPVNDAYGILNARLAWRGWKDRGVEVALFGRNLGDTEYAISQVATAYSALGTVTDLLGPPRVVGVELSYRFGSDR